MTFTYHVYSPTGYLVAHGTITANSEHGAKCKVRKLPKVGFRDMIYLAEY